jgi:chemotaxis protein CheD
MAQISVGISDWKVCRENDTLITYALGSCVGICMYDREKHVAGLSHIMLPDSTCSSETSNFNRMKFADTAIPDMYNKLLSMGASHNRITAKIAGGALMFTSSSDRFNIGERNVAAVKAALQKIRVPIIASDTGLNFGRTVIFYTSNGNVEVKSTIHGIKVL